MIIAMIKGFTRVCGKSQGYLGLPVRDMIIIDKATGQETPAMHTAWTPTPDELERLNKGANIIVCCLGTIPVPMMLDVDIDLPAMPVVERKPIAYRWRSIMNPDHWSYSAERPTDHPQYITEPLYSS